MSYLVSIFPHFITRQFIVSILNTTKMRKTIVILAIIATVATAFASCASSRGGCAMSAGYVGYGHSMGR